MRITVNFTSQGRMLEGVMFLPEDTKQATAACLFEGSATGATNQVTEYIAREVSEEGFVCLIMDHSYYGEYETSPLSWESPSKRIMDIKAALHFLEKHASVDKERIVGVGVSVGAEYLAQACDQTGVCKGLILVEGPFDDSQNVISKLDIPFIVVDETHLKSTVDEVVLWMRTLFQGGLAQEARPSVDWSVSDE